MDLALSSLSGGIADELDGPADGDATFRLPERRYYDHYEVCLTPDGDLLELGRGAMGITYKAMDMHLGCPVALKIVNTLSLEGSAARARLLREARAAARLRHPSIASIYHLGLDDEHCYYSMEYIEGKTLEAFVRDSGPMSVEAALDVVIQAAKGLSLAHERHFIHRDIKPSNLMLVLGGAGNLQVKIIDFGLVKAVTDEGSVKDQAVRQYFAGTPHYASPEQLEIGTVDARSDIYSLGVCLWYILAGRIPVPTASFSDGPSQGLILQPRAASSLSHVPAPALDLLGAMVADDPAARPQSAAELLLQIQQCRVQLASEQVAGSASPSKGRRGWKVSVAFGMMFAILAVAIVLVHGKFMGNNSQTSNSPATTGQDHRRQAKLLYAQAEEAVFPPTKESVAHAIELYREAITCAPDFADAHAGLAIAYFQNLARFGASPDQLGLAVASAERSIALDPLKPRGYHALGAIRTLQGRSWDALAQVHRALETDPTYLPAMREIGNLWMTVGQPQFALPWAKSAAELDPTMIAGWSIAADAYLDLRLDQEAERCYSRALAISPTWMTSHCGLMHIHLLEGDYARANQDYEVARSIDPGALLPLHLKAQVELFGGHFAEAETLYRQLLVQKRSGYVSYYGGMSYLSALGYLRRRAGDHTESNALLSEAVGLHAGSEGPNGIYDLAAIQAIRSNKTEALSLLRQAIAAGWVDYRSMGLDPRFETISGEPEFQNLTAGLRRQVDAMREEGVRLCTKPLQISDYPIRPPAR